MNPVLIFAPLLIAAGNAQPFQDSVNTTRSSNVQLELPTEEEGFVFVVFGDRTGGPAEGIAVLQQAVRDANLLDPDLVMTVGDLIEGYNTQDPWIRQMLQFKSVMSDLNCPWFPVAGNHDVYWRGAGRPSTEHESDYEEHFGPLWYDFSHRNSHFIALYTDEGNPRTGERNFSKPESQVMSDEQLAFLRSALERGAAADHVFVFLHHPRWLGGGYGNDWDRVHKVLAEAGNVRACFAGHIHHMRHDGIRDGIEYICLATVGGHQHFFAPEAGWDHQFHVVTVRPDRTSMAAVPIDELLDVRDITATVSADTRALAKVRPQITAPLPINDQGGCESQLGLALTNPTKRPIMVQITPSSADARWSFTPSEAHQRIGGGETAVFSFKTTRTPLPLDDSFHAPTLTVDIEYLTDLRSYTIPTITMPVPTSP